MLWIYGLLLVCYMPHITSLFVTLFTGLNTTCRRLVRLHLSSIAGFVTIRLQTLFNTVGRSKKSKQPLLPICKCTFETLQDKKYSKFRQIAMKGCPFLLPGKKVMLAATWRFVIKFIQGTL